MSDKLKEAMEAEYHGDPDNGFEVDATYHATLRAEVGRLTEREKEAREIEEALVRAGCEAHPTWAYDGTWQCSLRSLTERIREQTEREKVLTGLLRDASEKLHTEGHGKWAGTIDIDAALNGGES